MAELADALDSGSNGRKAVQVQVLLPAPRIDKRTCCLSILFSANTESAGLAAARSRSGSLAASGHTEILYFTFIG